jgi:hypothetical protein
MTNEIAHLHCNRAPFGAVHVSRYALAMTIDVVGDQIYAFTPLARLSL